MKKSFILMIQQGWENYRELDPAKKDSKWASNVITNFRTYWRPIVNYERYINNMNVLLGIYDMSKIRSQYKDETFLTENPVFQSIDVWEKLRNVIIDTIVNNPPTVEVTATDPTAIKDKKKDMLLLTNRKLLENDLTNAQTAVGMNPYKMDSKKFKGNVDSFDQMGLNETDVQDVAFFFETYFKLNYETAAQSLVQSILNINKTSEKISRCVNDILAVKVVCFEPYVNKVTGEIKYRYIQPNLCYGILGTELDCSDATCLGYEKNMPVWQWIEEVGNDFDWETDWPQLLWAINYRNGWQYTGFIRNGIQYDTWGWGPEQWGAYGQNREGSAMPKEPNLVAWDNAQLFNVSTGKIQFFSVNGTSYKVNIQSQQAFKIGFADRVKENTNYQKESYYDPMLYEAVYLATSSVSQLIVSFGTVYHQLKKEGYYDQYCGYGFKFYVEQGISAVEVSLPFFEMVQETFWKMKWCISKAKPDSEVYWLPELRQLARSVDAMNSRTGQPQKGQTSMENVLMELITTEHKTNVRLRDYPRDDNGNIAQNAPTNDKQHNGLDPVAISMQTLCIWAENMISDKIGLNEIVAAPRVAGKVVEAANQQTRAATGYITNMIVYMYECLATCTLLYVSDILAFKDTLPYRWLQRLAGEENIEALQQLEGIPAHRYGIFCRSIYQIRERQKMEAIIDQALGQQDIDMEQYLLLMNTPDYKVAAKKLAYMKEKAKAEKRNEMAQMQANAMQLQQNQAQNQAALIDKQYGYQLQDTQMKVQGGIQEAQINAGSKERVKQMTVDSEPEKQASKAQAKKEEIYTKANVEEQTPYEQT